jgi:hypothetical protein
VCFTQHRVSAIGPFLLQYPANSELTRVGGHQERFRWIRQPEYWGRGEGLLDLGKSDILSASSVEVLLLTPCSVSQGATTAEKFAMNRR